MVVDEEAPTGDEQADFADMLKKFKQGVADNVDAEDHEAHYDLGVAYKEMGLLDEAISEFQKAIRSHLNRVRTYEALGQCFLEKKQLPVAATILQRALSEPGARDEQLVGVLYLLGYINESLGKPSEAKGFYERVFGVDIQFRDVGDRLNAVDKALVS
jgi:tetratricopeptide (TPR) repeat protein